MKRLLCLLLGLCCLSGCMAVPASAPTETPLSGIPGYYSLAQQVEGGRSVQAGLDSVSVLQRQEETILTLAFSGEEGVPAYSVTGLENPSRLCLEMELSGRDFAGQEVPETGLFSGLFYEAEGESVRLYLQFRGNIGYKLAEDGQNLVVTVRADDMTAGQAYYLRLPYEESVALLASEEGLTPALSEDAVTLTYISAPYASLEEVEAARLELEESLAQAGSDATPQISAMANGAAPEVLQAISRQALNTLGALRLEDGSVQEAEVFALDARFLCWMPDGVSAVVARPLEGEEAGEEVWIYSLEGQREKLFEGEFSSLQKAAVTADGRYLSLVEQLSGARMVYVYDRQQGGLELLSAQGFGDYTSDIAWSAENKLYAMTGNDVMQLMVYDPSLSGSEQSAVRAVEEREGTYGTLGCAGGWVYFSDEFGDILRVNPETTTRELFTPGDGFQLSNDGQFMAVTMYIDNEDGSVTSYLSVKSIQGQEQAQVEMGSQLWNMCWDKDSKTLYYLLANPGDPDYPSSLYAFDIEGGQSRKLGDLAAKTAFTGTKAGELILLAYLDQDGSYRPVCYSLDLNGLA